MTTKKQTTTATPTAPPPAWPSRGPRPGTFRDTSTLRAADVYAAAVELGLDLPPDLTGAVAALGRALDVSADLSAKVAAAEAEWTSALVAHVEQGAPAPAPELLERLGSTVAVRDATAPYAERVIMLGEQSESRARAAVKTAGGTLVAQAQARHTTLLDDLAPVAGVIAGMATLADAARAQLAHTGDGLAPLDAWAALDAGGHTYRLLLEVREGLTAMTRHRDEVAAIERHGWHEAAHLAPELIPNGAEPPARLAALVAHRDKHGTRLPDDAELSALLVGLRTGPPKLQEATRRGLRTVPVE